MTNLNINIRVRPSLEQKTRVCMTPEKLWSPLKVVKFPTEKLLRENIEVLDKLWREFC